jgi:hypothetical protein
MELAQSGSEGAHQLRYQTRILALAQMRRNSTSPPRYPVSSYRSPPQNGEHVSSSEYPHCINLKLVPAPQSPTDSLRTSPPAIPPSAPRETPSMPHQTSMPRTSRGRNQTPRMTPAPTPSVRRVSQTPDVQGRTRKAGPSGECMILL